MTGGGLVIRRGGAADIPAILDMLDLAGEWLVAQGRTGQWGTRRQSTLARRQEQARIWAESDGVHMAELSGEPVGALIVGIPVGHIPPASEPELYVNLLLVSRRHQGLGIGGRLLERARELAREAGVGLVRLDCYDAGDRKLVRYYESQGFTATESLTFGAWTGRIMECRVAGRG